MQWPNPTKRSRFAESLRCSPASASRGIPSRTACMPTISGMTVSYTHLFPVWFCRVVVTASGIFSSFLKFIIPLMIVAYVTMGIADLKSGAGKLLIITVALAYGSTLIAGSASYLVSASLFPSFMSEGALEQIAATADNSLASYLSISIPPILDTLSAVVLAFVMGLCLSTLRGLSLIHI